MTIEAERRSRPRPPKESRHRGREIALQMLYQWEVGRSSMFEVRQTFWTDAPDIGEVPSDLRQFATTLADGVAEHVAQLDVLIAESAEHWRVERMNVLDRLILRLAVYEFQFEPQTPARVIINEALELARTFGGDESVRFVNGILDAVRRKLQRE